MAVQWKFKNTGGGNVPADLVNRVQTLETENTTNKTNITNLQQNTAKLNQNNTYTGTNTFNNQVAINSGTNDFTWETTRTWNQNIDNTVAKTKDFKFVRKLEYTSGIVQPNNTWNTTSWNWTLNDLNAQDGIHEFLVGISIENTVYNFNTKIIWKNGLTDSQSPLFILEHDDTTYHFKIVVKNNNKFYIYNKKISGTKTIQWVRGWIVRDNNLPWKANQLW